ncbi:helix-turn-helix domain-containing protein [Pseudomonas fuscovaginae UPB0736]|uniref:Transcriptional regulator, AraC family n=1 Tax=Pseudomonas asplenii TaxID=53407 RepID=A0A1H6P6W3_9PSED|nr:MULTISPECIES: helix-turn-helix domain-containing protein [Pseudomonas]UUQ64890.1 helix-turn-helix domain-containing protein [Pseudomonas fuscovaginae UPB0736]UZE26632.1 helix-turn-helix domain-containing protein [Pseudomonas asplenii]SEI20294.1 transcriptional regulator, AraC family [Pseudomonas fuscovaginae]
MSALSCVSTDQFGRSDRLTKWQEFMSIHVGRTPESVRRLELTSFQPLEGAPFAGRLEYGDLGDLHFCRMVSTPHRFSRRLNAPVTPSEAPWLLILQMRGISHFSQGTRSHSVSADELMLIDSGKPFEVTSPNGCEYLMLLCNGLTGDVAMPSDLHLNNRAGLGKMLHHLITDAYSHYPLLNARSSHSIGQSITALVENLIEKSVAAPKLEHDFRYFKKHRIKSFIEDRLAEPELTLEQIATFEGCSIRTLHRLFEDELGCSLSEYIWQRRLTRCAEDLRNPDLSDQSITDVALSWGFVSSSHFSRAFKASFGMTPRLFRETS